jgi:DUF1009 family protein
MAVQSDLNRQKTEVSKRSIALIAGDGKLPVFLARSAKEKGCRVVAIALSAEAQERVEAHADKIHLISPGQLGRGLKLLQQEGLKEVVFIGKIPKLNILSNLHKLDWTAIRALSSLSDFNDDTIQRKMGDIMESYGVKVLTQREFLRDLFPNVGVMTKRQPTAAEYADIEFGFRIAKECARLEIGQTVIVRDQMIMAIEAIEGTDRAIQRAVELARRPVVVVKVSRPSQDQRFDIPTAGMTTLQSMVGAQPGGVLAIEAGETLMVEREEMIAFAEEHGIAIVAV